MSKKVWLGAALVLSASAVAGFLYANHQAEQLMAGHIERSNQQYLQLAEQGDMPPIHMSYSKLSANVITSSYKIQNLHIGLAGMGDLVTVGQVELIGLQRDGLPEDGAARLKDLKLAPQALASLPKDLADYLATLLLELNYQYKYKAKTGELTFQQELRVDHHFSLNYRFAESLAMFARYSRGGRAGADKILFTPAISTTSRLVWGKWPAWLMASRAIPPVIAPSPMIAATL